MSRLSNGLSTLLIVATLGGATTAQQATLITVPGAWSASDITPDGTVVVGTLNSGGGYYWRWQQDPAPIAIGGSTAEAVSDDGSVITGNMDHPVTGQQIAGRWTAATGWVPLTQGALGECGSISSGYDISGDGKHIVGLAWNGCSGRGFLWTEPGILGTRELQNLGNGQNRASTISRDGSEIGGFAQGDFNRTPAVWDPANLAGTVFDMQAQGEIYGFSDDGKTLLGEWINPAAQPNPNIDAFYWPGWKTDPTQQNLVILGSLNPGWNGQAVDMAEPPSGSSVPPLIVGYDSQGLGGEAWVWTPAGGIQQLQAMLTGLGVPSVPELAYCQAITPDGGTIVGHTAFQGAWIVDFPTPGQVSVYGCGGNPAGSMTVLSGTPEIGTTLTLGLDNPLGSQPAGSLPFLFLATKPSVLYPCGTSLPGTGMGGGSGELLIDIIPPNPILPALQGFPWAGPGSPAPVPLAFPVIPNLVGKKLYAQGALIDVTFTGIPLALTDAVDMTIGG